MVRSPPQANHAHRVWSGDSCRNTWGTLFVMWTVTQEGSVCNHCIADDVVLWGYFVPEQDPLIILQLEWSMHVWQPLAFNLWPLLYFQILIWLQDPPTMFTEDYQASQSVVFHLLQYWFTLVLLMLSVGDTKQIFPYSWRVPEEVPRGRADLELCWLPNNAR